MSLSSPSRMVFLWTDSMRPKSAASNEIHPAVTPPLSTQTLFSMSYPEFLRRSSTAQRLDWFQLADRFQACGYSPSGAIEQAEDRYTEVLRNNQTDTGG